MKHIKLAIISIFALFSFAFAPAVVGGDVASAAVKDEICKGINNGGACNQTGENDLSAFLKRITNILLFIVGSVAVIMLIVGGLRYVLSGGDASQTKAAKDTILYAIIGIVVATAAYAIVNFVVVNI
jgi:hypothetical protein